MSDQAEKLRQKMMILRDPLKDVDLITVIEVQPGAKGSLFTFNLAKSFVSLGEAPFLFSLEKEISEEEALSVLLNLKSYPIKADIERGDSIFSEETFVEREGVTLYLASQSEPNTGFKEIISQAGTHLLRQQERTRPFFVYQTAELAPAIDELDKASFLLLVTKGEPTDLVETYTLVKKIHLIEKTLPIGIVVTRVNDEKGAKQSFETLNAVSMRFLEHSLLWCGYLTKERQVLEGSKRKTKDKSIYDQCAEQILKGWRNSLIKE